MTAGKENDPSSLIRLADSLAEDILKKSDEEVLEEFRENGANSIAHAEKMQAFVEKAILHSNKQRLDVAKAGAAASHQSLRKFSRPVDIAEARKKLLTIGKNSFTTQSVTLAARNEKELSDADVLTIFEDLVELGVIIDCEVKDSKV